MDENKLMRWRKLHLFFLILSTLVAIGLKYPQPELDVDYYLDLASKHVSLENDFVATQRAKVLQGITVVVTGPTSGLGLAISHILHGHGATIIAIGRSLSKLAKLKQDLDEDSQDEGGNSRVIPIVADFKDLDSVAYAADEVTKICDKLDYIINNAGMVLTSFGVESATKQGFDTTFGVNYLAPFLLTDKLLPLMEKSTMHGSPRIVQVASTKHFTINGHSLVPSNTSSSPSASLPSLSIVHGWKSYSESKLAQIYHTRSLARDLQGRKSSIQVVSLCPSWVATNIAGDGFKNILDLVAFEPSGFGVAPYLFAMFHPQVGMKHKELLLNDYVTNCSVFCNNQVIEWIGRMLSFDKSGTIRHMVFDSLSFVAMLIQKPFSAVDFQQSSVESYNEDNQDALYKWTRDTLAPWL